MDVAPFEVGPLPISDALREVLRLVRAIHEALPTEGPELEPVAQATGLEFLARVEESVGATLPYDVVALAVLRIPVLRRAVGLHVARLDDVARDCAGEFGPPRGWVAVASFGEGAMRAEAEHAWGVGTLLCVREGARDRAGDPEVRTTDGETTSPPTRLSALLRERLSRRYAFVGEWQALLAAARADARPLDEPYVARLVDDRRAPPPALGKVRHAKFGVGQVLRALEGDKLEVDFGAAGTKTLLRRFVTDA